MLKRRFAIVAALLVGPPAYFAQSGSSSPLVPAPASITPNGAAAFVLQNPVRIVVPSGNRRVREIGDFLADVIRTRTGFAVRVSSDARGERDIRLDTALASNNHEAYELTSAAGELRINGASSTGLLWGVQTLRQLLPVAFDSARGSRPSQWTVPAVHVRDAPRFAWRGSMIDAGRHFLPANAVKRHIDMISRYKMNVLHWHLTEDQGWRIEIRKYPKLTSVGAWRKQPDGSRYGGFYTQQDIRDVVEYARVRGVTVVPEIEMPGHSQAALAAYPELGCTGERLEVATEWGVHADVYCAGKEHTFTFLQNVLDEVMTLFPSKYIHIGGDEVPKDRWRACDSCQAVMRREKLANETELQAWFVRRIGDYLAKHGRTLIGWDEVLEGGLREGSVAEIWRDTAFTRLATTAGHDVIVTPDAWTYFNHSASGLTLDRVYAFDPLPPGLDSAASKRVLGGEAALWSEHITSPANLELMAFPRMLALSEVLWSSAPRNLDSFVARLERDHLPRLSAMGVAVGPADTDIATIGIAYDSVAHAARVRASFGVPGVTLRATSDGSAPTAKSPEVRDSAVIAGDGVKRLQPFYRDEPILAERRIVMTQNKATGHPVRVTPNPSRQYRATGSRALTDGIHGTNEHADGLWQGWLRDNVDAVVDLESVQPIDTIRVTYLQIVRSWIVLPTQVDFFVSEDGTNWTQVGSMNHRVPVDRDVTVMQSFAAIMNPGTRARYVRVVGVNSGPLPAWHPGAGRPSWLFTDEIVVR